MGASSTCCHQDVNAIESEPPQIRQAISPKKVGPLLRELEVFFDEHGAGRPLQVTHLAKMWKDHVEQSQGELTPEDIATIDESAKVVIEAMDVDGNGKISREEFFAYVEGGNEDRAQFRNMRTELRKEIKRTPGKLNDLVGKFMKWDRNGDGLISPQEFEESLRELASEGKSDMGIVMKELMEEADVDGDGHVDMWELLAHAMGRRKKPVEIILYDISNGVAKNFSKLLLGRNFEGIYHSGCICFGSEFWFGGQVLKSPIGSPSKNFGQPIREAKHSTFALSRSCYPMPESWGEEVAMVVHIGFTLCTLPEFLAFVQKDIVPKYNQNTYDVETHNCCHFCDELVTFLTGQSIPADVRDQAAMAFNTPLARMLRPVLNAWLGGFGSEDTTASTTNGTPSRRGTNDDIMSEVFASGTIAVISADDPGNQRRSLTHQGSIETQELLAEVINVDGDDVELKYFDPTEMKFVHGKRKRADIKRFISKAPAHEGKGDWVDCSLPASSGGGGKKRTSGGGGKKKT